VAKAAGRGGDRGLARDQRRAASLVASALVAKEQRSVVVDI